MRLENLSAGYRKKIIVRDLSLELGKGEIISLIGPNGGGKSTILKSLSGQLEPLGGAVFLGKERIKDISLKELSKKMSIVTTERINPHLMTVRDMVLSGRIPYSDGLGLFDSADREAASAAIKRMKIEGLSDRYYSDLSDGQKQRTLIARAICQSPQVLIMDEPTSYLDIRHRMELMDVIRGLSNDGISIITSLHELELALEISDRLLLVYDDGRTLCDKPENVVKSGMIKDLYGLDDKMYRHVLNYIMANSI